VKRSARLSLLVASALSLAHFASFDLFDSPVLTDVRYFLYFAWQIAEGATPYLDLFDPKTPLASFAGALLWRLGSALGVEPLYAVRVGYLGLATLGGVLGFVVFRRLGDGRPAAGFLGLAAGLSFGLLGELPAIGNIPKLLMVLSASATALLCFHRRWGAAGFVGALGFLDWQFGILAWLGAFATALLYGEPRHRAALSTMFGAVVALVPFVLYFAARGALGIALEQTVVAALFRGASSLGELSAIETLERVIHVLQLSTDIQWWLCLAAPAGVGVVVWWLVSRRTSDEVRLLVPLAIYHFGIVFVMLIDFQGFGDAFATLHSLAFFLGALWVALLVKIEGLVPAGRPAHFRRTVTAAAVVLAFVAARPGPFRAESPRDRNRPSLSSQRDVAAQLDQMLGDRVLVAVESSEMLVLLRRPNPLPFIYWNSATWGHYCDPDREPAPACLDRWLDSTGTDVRIVHRASKPNRPRPYGLQGEFAPGAEWSKVTLRASSGRYRAVVHERKHAD